MKKTSSLQYIMIYSALLLAVAWSIYPILRVITISIRPGDNLLTESLSIIPEDWTFENYIKLFADHPFGTWIWNSILVTATVMLTGVTLASTAGYALSRFRFPGREASLLSGYPDVSRHHAAATPVYHAFQSPPHKHLSGFDCHLFFNRSAILCLANEGLL